MLGLLFTAAPNYIISNLSQMCMMASVIIWSVSIRKRIIQLNMRKLLIAQGVLLLLLLFI